MESCQWQTVPEDVLVMVFAKLKAMSIFELCRALQVCRHWLRCAAEDPRLWR
jgi:hypothetical protein